MMDPDEDGFIPWRWRNLLHWQNVHAQDLSELTELVRQIRNLVWLIAVLMVALTLTVILV